VDCLKLHMSIKMFVVPCIFKDDDSYVAAKSSYLDFTAFIFLYEKGIYVELTGLTSLSQP
jgi:hypothetical protein